MTQYDVVGIGNAIVDIIAESDDITLDKLDLQKGSMTLVDEARMNELYARMGTTQESSGGSAANTLAGIAQLGAKCGFIGKVKDDQFGRVFRHDMIAVGVDFTSAFYGGDIATASCLVFVTQDADGSNTERTMATFLGACKQVTDNDMDRDMLGHATLAYIEGYLWDTEREQNAIMKGISVTHNSGGKVAFTLSDTFCVDRHRGDFQKLVEQHVDIVFANESEILALYQKNSLEEVLPIVQKLNKVVAITRNEQGSMVVHGEKVYSVDAVPVERVVDVTGAGDLYAAGFLYGYVKDMPLPECARLGSACASEVIQIMGARLGKNLKDKVLAA